MQHQSFNILDTLILAAVFFSMIIGSFRGFIREFFGLSSWAGAAYMAVSYHNSAKPIIMRCTQDPMLIQVLSYAAIFCCALIVFLIISHLIFSMVHSTFMGSVDRSLGLAFGVLRGVFLVSAFYTGSLFMVNIADQPSIMKTAYSVPFLNKSALFLEKIFGQFLPESLSKEGHWYQNIELIRSMVSQQDIPVKIESTTPPVPQNVNMQQILLPPNTSPSHPSGFTPRLPDNEKK